MQTEGEYQSFFEALSEFLAGRKPVSVLLDNSEFRSRLEGMCYHFERERDKALDLFQDACVRLMTYEHAIHKVRGENTEQFFSWLFVLVRHLWLDTRTRDNDSRQRIADTAIEDLQLEDPGLNPEAQCLWGEFTDFKKTLPYTHRRAIELHLSGFSLRQIAKILRREGYDYSHVMVKLWISHAHRDFKRGSSVKKAIGF